MAAEVSTSTHTIYINKKPVSIMVSPLAADAILIAGGYEPQNYSLFLVPNHDAGAGQTGGGAGQPGQTGGGAGQPGQTVEVKPGQTVPISDGLHFNAILKDVPYG